MTTPYFYIIEEKSTGKYYAGSRYAKGCHPSDLLSTYHTSCRSIQDKGSSAFRIRKIVPREDALSYETRFLRKVDARSNPRFINKHNNQEGFSSQEGTVTARSKETGECSRITVEEYYSNKDKWETTGSRNSTGKSFIFFGEHWNTKKDWELHYKANRKALHRYWETGRLSPVMTNEEWIDLDTREKKLSECRSSNLKRGLEKCGRDKYGKYLPLDLSGI
jgi:hypothetical protein